MTSREVMRRGKQLAARRMAARQLARTFQGPPAWEDLLLGLGAGLAASFVMEKAQSRISSLGSEEEAVPQGAPATVQAAESAAGLVGKAIPEERKALAGESVHYLYGAAWGALFALARRRIALPALAAGAVFGAALWVVSDEILVPALGLSAKPTRYPASTHAKALAAHVVYGLTADGALRAMHAVAG